VAVTTHSPQAKTTYQAGFAPVTVAVSASVAVIVMGCAVAVHAPSLVLRSVARLGTRVWAMSLEQMMALVEIWGHTDMEMHDVEFASAVVLRRLLLECVAMFEVVAVAQPMLVWHQNVEWSLQLKPKLPSMKRMRMRTRMQMRVTMWEV